MYLYYYAELRAFVCLRVCKNHGQHTKSKGLYYG